MTERSSRQMFNVVSFRFASELVPVPRNNEEILYILSDAFTVRPPEWRDGVEEERECVHTYLPKLLVVVTIVLFESGDLGQLRGQ